MSNSRLIRVSREFYDWLNEIAKQSNQSLIKTSKKIMIEHQEIFFKISKNKKGSVFDILLLTIILFAMTFFIILGYKTMTEINTEFQNSADLSSNSKTYISDLKGRFVNLFDGIFITIMIILSIAIGVGVYYLDLHPIFYLVSLFVIIFIIIIAAVFANSFSDLTDDPDLETQKDEFTLMPYVMEKFPFFIMVLTFLIIIVMYAKNRSD